MQDVYIKEQINRFLAEVSIALMNISSQQKKNISSQQIRDALVLYYDVDCEVDLLSLELTSKEITTLLSDFDFDCLIPLAEILLETSILPDNVPLRFVEAQAKHINEIWVVHKNDVDPFPSNPHAHMLGTGYKLHLGNGWLYQKREKISVIKWKDLLAIREKLNSIVLPPLERA